MCTHQAHDDVHTTGTKIAFFVWCDCCVPHVCTYFCNSCLSNIRKVSAIYCRMSIVAQKLDICGALWLNLKFENIFEQNRKFLKKCWKFQNFRFFSKIFSNFKFSHRAAEISDFCAMELIRLEIVQTFWMLFKHELQNYLYTCGTQQAHHAKNAIFVPVVCTSSCAWCVHILGGARQLKVRH